MIHKGIFTGLLFAAVFTVITGMKTAAGEPVSDFEKLLQDAIQENKNSVKKVPDSEQPKFLGDPKPLPAKADKPKPAPVSDTAASDTAAEIIDNGWTTVVPNKPGIIVPEAEIKTGPKPAAAPEIAAVKPEQEPKPVAARGEDSKTEEVKTEQKPEIIPPEAVQDPPETVQEPPLEPMNMPKKADVPDFDVSDKPYSVLDASLVGDLNSKDKIKLMYDEILNGLRARNYSGKYEMWKNYAKRTIRDTEGINTGSELDGRCRLSWYKELYADPIQSVFKAEEYTRELHHGLSSGHRGFAEVMPGIRKRIDVSLRNDGGIKFPVCTTPAEALAQVKTALTTASAAHAKYLSRLTQTQIDELKRDFAETFAGKGCINGHTVPARSVGRRMLDILDNVDRSHIFDAAEAFIPLTNPSLLALLDKLNPESVGTPVMLNGVKVHRLSTSAGDIIIGGREDNVYDLDSPAMKDVICVIDLGGNDTYREGTCNLDRPVFAIIDLHGNDTYTGSKPGIQGGSILGVSFLLDAEGDDTYNAVDVAQGSTMGGAGILIDFAGNDKYKGLRRVQGHALSGLGMLIDKRGNDDYRAALWAQGFGAPHGFGVLEDVEGNDRYYCGGLYLDSYPEHPGYDGWGQGIGAGIRQVANGGIGVLLDGAGDDDYQVDYFGQGGGYWLGVGFARDFGGNDVRHGTTKTAYNGGPRREQEWTRFANGFGCHYSLGFCFDDGGDDVYGGRIMGTGMAWDLSIGYLCDFGGNDKFTATGGMTQGVGAEGSIGILFKYGGNDVFEGRNQAYASSSISYHSPSNCGSNFSFLINYGGNDKYGSGAKNNTYVQRGSPGGFLIDRPTESEAAQELIALKAQIEQRNKEIADYDADFAKNKEEYAARGRRYVPRTKRPKPIEAEQLQLGAVPDFGKAMISRTASVPANATAAPKVGNEVK